MKSNIFYGIRVIITLLSAFWIITTGCILAPLFQNAGMLINILYPISILASGMFILLIGLKLGDLKNEH